MNYYLYIDITRKYQMTNVIPKLFLIITMIVLYANLKDTLNIFKPKPSALLMLLFSHHYQIPLTYRLSPSLQPS